MMDVTKKVTNPPAKPVLIYDGDCGFCRRWIARWQKLTKDRIDYAPYQQAGKTYTEIPVEQFKTAVQYIEPNGNVYSAAEAVFRSLANNPLLKFPLWLYKYFPAFAPITETLYRWVAKNRNTLSKSCDLNKQ